MTLPAGAMNISFGADSFYTCDIVSTEPVIFQTSLWIQTLLEAAYVADALGALVSRRLLSSQVSAHRSWTCPNLLPFRSRRRIHCRNFCMWPDTARMPVRHSVVFYLPRMQLGLPSWTEDRTPESARLTTSTADGRSGHCSPRGRSALPPHHHGQLRLDSAKMNMSRHWHPWLEHLLPKPRPGERDRLWRILLALIPALCRRNFSATGLSPAVCTVGLPLMELTPSDGHVG